MSISAKTICAAVISGGLLSSQPCHAAPKTEMTERHFSSWTLFCAKKGKLRDCFIGQVFNVGNGYRVETTLENREDRLVIRFKTPGNTAIESGRGMPILSEKGEIGRVSASMCNAKFCDRPARFEGPLKEAFLSGQKVAGQFAISKHEGTRFLVPTEGLRNALSAMELALR